MGQAKQSSVLSLKVPMRVSMPWHSEEVKGK